MSYMTVANGKSYLYLPRSAWTTSDKAGEDQGSPGTLYIHYTDSDLPTINTQKEAVAYMRQLDAQHSRPPQAYGGLGYGFVMFLPRAPWKRPRIFEARGFGKRPASQQGCNQGNTSIVVVASQRTLIYRSGRKALYEFYDRCPPSVRNVRGHRDCNDTDCPGDRLYRLVWDMRKRGRKKVV